MRLVLRAVELTFFACLMILTLFNVYFAFDILLELRG